MRRQESIETLLSLLINDPEWGIINCIHQGKEVDVLTKTPMIKFKVARNFYAFSNLWNLDEKNYVEELNQ